MDSKQLANLKQVSEDAKKPIVIHDLQEICKQKVLVNRITREFLKTQVKLSELSLQLQKHSIQNAAEKLKLVDRLIELYEKQCGTFDTITQEECLSIYSDLNDLNAPPPEIVVLLKTLNTLDDKLKDLSDKIEYFSARIPDEQAGVQYTIKKNMPDTTCAQDFLNPSI